MQNFGLRDMRLVRPAGGEWPNERARAVSARAIDVLDGAKVGKCSSNQSQATSQQAAA